MKSLIIIYHKDKSACKTNDSPLIFTNINRWKNTRGQNLLFRELR